MAESLPSASVRDLRGRALRDLRVSVTDRCNFRCDYCMPGSVYGPGYPFLRADALLSFEQIVQVVEASVGLGVIKVRLTGGEPLLRPQLARLVEQLARVDGLREIALTTNGLLLARHARTLRDAGLTRITVSLDSLEPARFARMSGANAELREVLAGIDAAQAAGFESLCVNTVVRRHENEEDVLAIAQRFRGTGITVRFIEYMDVGGTIGWTRDAVVTADEILRRLNESGPLVRIPAIVPSEVARRFAWADGSGEIGIIASVTQPFCGDCVRLRLSAEGTLYSCLFATSGTSLRSALNERVPREELADRIRSTWVRRSDNYSEVRESRGLRGHLVQLGEKVRMSMVGG